MNDTQQQLQQAEQLAVAGDYPSARAVLLRLLETEDAPRNRIENDLAAIAAAQGHSWSARLHASQLSSVKTEADVFTKNCTLIDRDSNDSDKKRPVKVILLSLLFNWPSTGGGTVHTKELASFLARDGYEVLHLYAVNESFGVGRVTASLDYPSQPIMFSDTDWRADIIRSRFQQAVQAFAPNWAIVTDSWNTKPLLVESVRDVPYFIRIAAQENLCPLNNVRMLMVPEMDNPRPKIVQCDRNQLAEPQTCHDCVLQNVHLSGGLHKAERVLGGFHDNDYRHRLTQSFAEAEGILVVNPEIAELVRPYTPAVHVVPSGFDPLRFPVEYQPPSDPINRPTRILFAGLRDELMKGFYVLESAAEQLWEQRQDFELWITGDAHNDDPPYLKSIGWQSQEQLTQAIVACDLLVFPTVAQEALGRSAVEAMGCGRPVLASRIGGLKWVIEDGQTGVLFEPGDVDDLCRQLVRLLDDGRLREQLGRAGRDKFQREFTWESIFERSYRRLFGPAYKQFAPLTQEVTA